MADCRDKKLIAFRASVFLQAMTMNYEELDLKNVISYIAYVPIIVPSDVTARIQESHIMIGHFLAESINEVI